jgi:phage FluMu protein gp41
MTDYIKTNADGSVTVTLAAGIDISGARVKVVTMREPTVADQIAAQEIKGTAAAQEVALIANLAQITPDEVKGMTLRDYRRVQEALVGFTA